MITVRTFSDNGPYFPPTVMKYQANCLKDVLFHTRLAMEDGEDTIAVYHDDHCVGLWQNDAEPEPDGEGGWLMPSPCYVLLREENKPQSGFQAIVRLFQGEQS